MTPDQIDRVAHVAAILRPDWPLSSLRTWLAGFADRNPHRTLHDTLHATIDVADDPASRTLARLEQQGPWWRRHDEQVTPRPSPFEPGPVPPRDAAHLAARSRALEIAREARAASQARKDAAREEAK